MFRLCQYLWRPALTASLHSLPQCLAVAAVNELVTCISRLLPRHVFPPDCFISLTYITTYFFTFFFSSLCPCFSLSCLCLHSQWMEITDSGRCSQEQRGSLLFSVFSLPLFFFPCWNAARCCAWGFLTSVCVCVCGGWGGSQERNPTIIVGWSGLAKTWEEKWIVCCGVFQSLTP